MLYAMREQEVLKSIKHTNLMTFLGQYKDKESAEQGSWLVAKLYGPDLEKLISSEGEMTEAETAIIVEQIVEGTAYMHKKSIIHR